MHVLSNTARENHNTKVMVWHQNYNCIVLIITLCLADYISNSENHYVFTNDTDQLYQLELNWLEIELVNPFMICLPDAEVLWSMGAQAVQPTCVTITIVDNDCKIILQALIIYTLIATLAHLVLIMPQCHVF